MDLQGNYVQDMYKGYWSIHKSVTGKLEYFLKFYMKYAFIISFISERRYRMQDETAGKKFYITWVILKQQSTENANRSY